MLQPCDVSTELAFDVESVWKEHAHFVYRFCFRLTNDKAVAEDLRQEVFMRILSKGVGYRGCADIRSWIYAIASNCCMDQFRRERRLRLDYVDLDQLEFEPAGTHLCVWDSPLCEWKATSMLELCQPLERALLELHFCEGLLHSDIASLLGITRAAVGKKIHKALANAKRRQYS